MLGEYLRRVKADRANLGANASDFEILELMGIRNGQLFAYIERLWENRGLVGVADDQKLTLNYVKETDKNRQYIWTSYGFRLDQLYTTLRVYINKPVDGMTNAKAVLNRKDLEELRHVLTPVMTSRDMLDAIEGMLRWYRTDICPESIADIYINSLLEAKDVQSRVLFELFDILRKNRLESKFLFGKNKNEKDANKNIINACYKHFDARPESNPFDKGETPDRWIDKLKALVSRRKPDGGCSPKSDFDEDDSGKTDAAGSDVTKDDSDKTDSTQFCTDENDFSESDAGETNSSESDAGETDSSESDTGETDSSESDAGETDSSESDAGETDSSESDAGETDSSESDTGEGDSSESDSKKKRTRRNAVKIGMAALLIGILIATAVFFDKLQKITEDPEPTKPSETQIIETEPIETELGETEPGETEPDETETDESGPMRIPPRKTFRDCTFQ